jgi:hypothetical protein
MKRKLLYFVVIMLAVMATLLVLFNPLNPSKSAAKATFEDSEHSFDIYNILDRVIGR